MQHYKDIDGDSGVQAYEYGADFIRVKFSTGAVYLYTNASAGLQNIAEMKKLADRGNGLNSFINLNVKKLYAKKEQ
jgi:hypothetical protein